MFENPRSRQARNFTTNVPKILDVKSSSEQIFSENCRWVPLPNAPLPPESPLPLHPTFFKLLSQDLDIERLY